MIIGSKIKAGAGREDPNLTTGSKGSKKSIKCISLDTTNPLDDKTAIEQLKNNKNLFLMFLCRFRNQEILPLIKQLSIAFEKENWNKFREIAHSLKGSSGYVGAGRIQYDCFHIQDFHYKNEIAQMKLIYNRMIENVIDFINFTKKYL